MGGIGPWRGTEPFLCRRCRGASPFVHKKSARQGAAASRISEGLRLGEQRLTAKLFGAATDGHHRSPGALVSNLPGITWKASQPARVVPERRVLQAALREEHRGTHPGHRLYLRPRALRPEQVCEAQCSRRHHERCYGRSHADGWNNREKREQRSLCLPTPPEQRTRRSDSRGAFLLLYLSRIRPPNQEACEYAAPFDGRSVRAVRGPNRHDRACYHP